MNANRVLLMRLSERTSAKGNRYMSGWLGKAGVVAFQAEEPDKWGNPQWDVFVATPEPRPEAGQDPARRPAAREAPADRSASPPRRGDGWRGQEHRRPANGAQRAPQADDGAFFDDSLEDLGR